jgi:Cu(I)/Ag(I) efflux system membrane fusion protein
VPMKFLSAMRKPSYAVVLTLLVVVSFLIGYRISPRREESKTSASGRRILYYHDPMHPAYKSDKPGIAPDCGMQLEPVYADDGSEGETADKDDRPALPPGTVHVSPEKQQTIGVRVGQVEESSGLRTVRLLGRVAVDETRIYRLNTATDGWVRETSSNSTGSLVKKDEVLATYYAPEFLGAEQAYFYALNSLDRFRAAGKETSEQIALTQISTQQAGDSLRNLGMGEAQLQELARTRQSTQNIELRSPVTGFVLVRNVSPGQRFERGIELYRIADLSRVWILADTFENEAQYFQPGVHARVILPNQRRAFVATVSEVLPQFDPATRTLKIRLEADNPGYVLRPDMFVDVELPVKLPAGITVPADAVLDSGLKKTVFVDRGNGYFEPRTVETGWRYGDQVEVVKGLARGERIVVSGNFLIDSESRMKLAAAGLYGNLNKDPVCGMDVSESKARASGQTFEHRGQTYYFCSEPCKTRFQQDPNRYLKQPPNANPSSAASGSKKESTKPKAAIHKDPICGMDVNESEATAAGLKTEYRGKTYYFCAAHCKQEFDKDPGRYAAQKASGEHQDD